MSWLWSVVASVAGDCVAAAKQQKPFAATSIRELVYDGISIDSTIRSQDSTLHMGIFITLKYPTSSFILPFTSQNSRLTFLFVWPSTAGNIGIDDPSACQLLNGTNPMNAYMYRHMRT
jgi:hypothetical protein